MAHLFVLPAARALSSTVAAVSGAKAYFYDAGTTEPRTTYTTPTLNVEHANPVVANSAGVFPPIYLDPTGGSYKVDVKSAGGVSLSQYPVDNNEVTLSQAELGKALYPITDNEATAGVTPTNYAYREGHAFRYGIAPSSDASTNTTRLNALALALPGMQVDFPKGIYQYNELTLTTGTHHWRGDGIESTRFQYMGTGTFINAVKSTDDFLPRSPIIIEGIGCFCQTKSTQVGISIKNRHDWALRDVTFDLFSTPIKLEMAYIGLLENVNSYSCNTGWDIVGDCNRVAFRSCGLTAFDTYGVRIRSGTFGNMGLTFENCDIEFGNGVCVRSESDDVIAFNECYIGDGTQVNVFEITTGKIVARGGLVQWGANATFTNRLVEFVGSNPVTDERSLTVERAKMTGGTYCGVGAEKMVKGDGKLYINNAPIATVPFWSGAAQVITGNPLGTSPGTNALLSPHGRTFTTGVTGGATLSLTRDLTTGSLFIQCTAAGAAADVIYAASTLQVGKLQSFGAVGMIVVYKSNSAFGLNLSSGAFNTLPALNLGSTVLPSTAGVLSTFVVQGQNALVAAYTTLEINRANCTIGDYIEIFEVYLFDERQSGGVGTLYAGKNLCKPI